MRRHLTTTCAAVCLCALFGTACGPGELEGTEEGLASEQEAITNGTLTSEHPSVGILLSGGSTSCAGQLFGSLCTATLVGKKTVLTAAHCIQPGKTHIFCLGQVTYQPQSLTPHPQWDSVSLANDIGVVILSTQPQGITPSIISRQAPTAGLAITLVGYGATGEGLTDAGRKRVATNSIKEVQPTRFSFAGTGGSIGNTCKGDSGGPAFATIGGRTVQAGVTSAGLIPCGTLGYDTRVDAYQSWLDQTSGGDLYAGDTEAPKVTITAPADNATVGKSVTFSVTATDNTSVTQVELFVDGASQRVLTAGPYTLSLTLADGKHTLRATAKDPSGNQGAAQVTVTVSSGPPPPPPAGYGAKCDGAQACASKICATAGDLSYCTQVCDPAQNTCPNGAECVSAGSKYVCAPPTTSGSLDGEVLVGSCAVGEGPSSGAPGSLLLLSLLGLALARRRGGPAR